MSREQELINKHGTLTEFSRAVNRAVGEISLDEADAAVEKYREELRTAREQDVKDARAN